MARTADQPGELSSEPAWWTDPARIADEIERCTTFAAIGSVVTAAMPTILVALRAQAQNAAKATPLPDSRSENTGDGMFSAPAWSDSRSGG